MKGWNTMSEKGTSLAQYVEHFGLEILNHGDTYETDKVESTNVNRPDLQILGLFDYFDARRIQVMGKAELTPALIPVDASKLPDPKADRIVNAPYTVDGVEYHVTCVSMGNPHCVVFKNDVETMDIEKIGPAFETSELFPERVNTEFIRVLDDHTLKMRVWERGSGETWACGTGACAAAVAAVENGYCKKDTDITVKLIGGDLVIRYTDDTVYMTGNAVTVYEGVVEI